MSYLQFQYKTSTLSLKFGTARKKRALEELRIEYNQKKAREKQIILNSKKPLKFRWDRPDAKRVAQIKSPIGLSSKRAEMCYVQACIESKKVNSDRSNDSYMWFANHEVSIVENARKSSKYSHYIVISGLGAYARKGTRKNIKFAVPVKFHKHFKKFYNNPRRYEMCFIAFLSPGDVKFVFRDKHSVTRSVPAVDKNVAVDFDKYGAIYTSNENVFGKRCENIKIGIQKALQAGNAAQAKKLQLEYEKYFSSQFKKMLAKEKPTRIILGTVAPSNAANACWRKSLDLCELYCVPSKVIHIASRHLICTRCGCKNNDNGDFYLAFFCERCEMQQNKTQTSCHNLIEEFIGRQTGSRRDKHAEYVAYIKALSEHPEIPDSSEFDWSRNRQRKRDDKRRQKLGLHVETPFEQFSRELEALEI